MSRRVRVAWEALPPGTQRVAMWLLVVGSSLAVVAYARCSAPKSATPAPIVQPVPLSALLNTTGREEVRDVAATPIGGAQAKWERYVRSSAQPLPLAPEAGSSEMAEAPGGVRPDASATAFESTRDVAVEEVEPVPAALAGASSTAATLTEAEMRAVLLEAGWPAERVEEGVRVACGPAYTRDGAPATWGESGCTPSKVGAAGEIGLFQLLPEWARDCDVHVGDLYLPVPNATCAYWILTYEEQEGLEDWHHWSVKPDAGGGE